MSITRMIHSWHWLLQSVLWCRQYADWFDGNRLWRLREQWTTSQQPVPRTWRQNVSLMLVNTKSESWLAVTCHHLSPWCVSKAFQDDGFLSSCANNAPRHTLEQFMQLWHWRFDWRVNVELWSLCRQTTRFRYVKSTDSKPFPTGIDLSRSYHIWTDVTAIFTRRERLRDPVDQQVKLANDTKDVKQHRWRNIRPSRVTLLFLSRPVTIAFSSVTGGDLCRPCRPVSMRSRLMLLCINLYDVRLLIRSHALQFGELREVGESLVLVAW